MPLTIVPARPSGSPVLTDVQRRQLEALDDIIGNGDGELRVAVLDGERVGHILVFLRMSPAVASFIASWNPDRPGIVERLERERCAYVTDVLVRENRRRRGVGSALLKDAAASARAAGLARIVLHVTRDNEAALRMYDRLGYARSEDTATTVELSLAL